MGGILSVMMISSLALKDGNLTSNHFSRLGLATGILFTTNTVKGFTQQFKLYDLLAKKAQDAWTRMKAPAVKIPTSLQNFVGKTLMNKASAMLPFVKKVASTLSKLVTIGNVAMVMAMVLQIRDAVKNWGEWTDFQKGLSIVGIATLAMNTVIGAMVAFVAIPGASIITAIGLAVALVVAIIMAAINVERDIKPKDDHPSVKYYSKEVHPDRSYWKWCDEGSEGKENCEQSVTASIELRDNPFADKIVMGGTYGGNGGKHPVSMLYNQTQSGNISGNRLQHFRVGKIKAWRCNDEDIGFKFVMERDLPACTESLPIKESCAEYQETHFGCGSNEGDRKHTIVLDIPKYDYLSSLKIYHTVKDVRTRRVVGLDFCTNNGECIETPRQPDRDYIQSATYNNYIEYQDDNGNTQGVYGEIVGFHGMYGDTIDRIGVYVRGARKAIYDIQLYDDSANWSHTWSEEGAVCTQFLNPNKQMQEFLEIFPDGAEFLTGTIPGRCQCEAYVSLSKTDGLHELSAQCSRCEKGSDINGECLSPLY